MFGLAFDRRDLLDGLQIHSRMVLSCAVSCTVGTGTWNRAAATPTTTTTTMTTMTKTKTTTTTNNNQVFRSRFLLEKRKVPQQVKNLPRTLWKLKVHYRFHNSLPLVFMSQINQVDALLFYLFKIRPSTSRFCKWPPSAPHMCNTLCKYIRAFFIDALEKV
jgi:hypothetical protein